MTPRILLVEDNAALGDNLREILEAESFEVDLVPSAEQGLAALHEGRFCGAVTDLRLPGMSGAELIARARAEGITTPIAIITAFASDDLIASAERMGALDILSKPLDIERLLQVVGEFSSSPPKVLVIEDNEEMADNLGEALREGSFVPIIAHTLRAALGQRNLPVAAIVDIELPDGNGLSAIDVLSARDPRIQIVITTGYAERQHVVPKGIPVLSKPFDLSELLRQLSPRRPA